jgi:nucleoid-associated protein YgaU
MKKGVFEMTADAKVGLLLGLFFIVIIAFLVNGLPNFIQEKDTSLANAAITTSSTDMILDNSNGASAAAHRLYPPYTVAEQRATQAPPETVVLGSSTEQQVEIPDLVPQRPMPVVVDNTPAVKIPAVAAASKAKTHVVKSGEILPVIAKLYYGEEQGNRRIVIQKLYEANTRVLKSPDRVRVGHKLVIPPLDELLNPSDKVVKAPSASESLLKKASDIIGWADKKEIRSISEYTVQEGDSLWSIAQQNLGNGNRYKEIAKLNKGKIKRVNDVVVGIRLKIPSQ